MLVALATHPGDLPAAQRLALWMRDLGGCRGHDLFLIRDTRIEIGTAQALKDVFRESFDNVVMLDFTDHYKKWPHSPTSVFGMVARHIGNTSKKAFLWIEPDCVFTQAGALDAIWNEYETVPLQKGKVFMGCFVPGIADSPDHMSGIGVYPGELIRYAGNALIAGDRPWDLAAASQIVPKCHFTKLISHTWRRQSFQTQEEVDAAIPKEAVLYHSSKDGSLIRLLRERMNLPGSASGQSVSRESAGEVLSISSPPREPQSTEKGGNTDYLVRQRWLDTHDGKIREWDGEKWTDEISEELPTIFNPYPKRQFIPWVDKQSSLARITELAQELRLFCTAPRNTAQVRDILEQLGIIPHIPKKRRRKHK